MDDFASRAAADGTLEDGPWLESVPSMLTEALARVEPAEVDAFALNLSQLEDFEGMDSAGISRLLTELASVALRADKEQKCLVLWSCL